MANLIRLKQIESGSQLSTAASVGEDFSTSVFEIIDGAGLISSSAQVLLISASGYNDLATDLEVAVVSASVSSSQTLISASISSSIAATLSGSAFSVTALSSSVSTSLSLISSSLNAFTSSIGLTIKAKMNTENVVTSSRQLDGSVINNLTFHHDSNKILSGFKDENGVALDLYTYLKSLQERILTLEEKIKRVKGELEVVILRNNQEFVVANGSETTFNIECESYLSPFTGSGIPSGRVFANNIYVIKDFIVKFRNKSTSSALGLLSSRTYLQNPDVYNTGAPQTFWVSDQDELITSDISGQTRTQLNNQYIWTVNYDSVLDTSVTKLTESGTIQSWQMEETGLKTNKIKGFHEINGQISAYTWGEGLFICNGNEWDTNIKANCIWIHGILHCL